MDFIFRRTMRRWLPSNNLIDQQQFPDQDDRSLDLRIPHQSAPATTPPGLAVANGYRNNVAQLTQGVINGNNGVSALQIIDGGLSNISTMLDRMQTLATESASTTFTGDRATLDTEYQTLIGEINREASNIGLSTTNAANADQPGVYIGGGQSATANSTG